jgi:hypothetical protein
MMRRMAAAAVATLAILLVASTAAHADQRRLELSRDGHRWSSSLRTPLFSPALRWVPGDRRTAHVWVRNNGSDPGRLVLSIRSARVDRLIRTGDLTVSARGGGGRSTPVHRAGTHPLLRIGALAPHHPVRVTIAVALAPTAANSTQARSLDLSFGVRLRQLTRRADHKPDHPDHGPFHDLPWWVAAGAGPLGVGAAVHSLVLARRPKTVTSTTTSPQSRLRGGFRG